LDDPNPSKGVRLARVISEQVGLEINLKDNDEDIFKFVRFTTKLRESLSNHNKIPIFFLHDFHRMTIIPDDLMKFIYNVALNIRNNFPKSLFIVAGLNCESLPNWHSELRQVFPIYNIENIEESTIKECLNCIFDKYKNKVFQLGNGQITKIEYIDKMISILIPEKPKINLAFVGSKISDHLIALKNM
jgi:hypothetical protein